MRKLSLQILILTACLFGGANGHAQDGIKLPDIGDSSGAIVSDMDEREYGEMLMREIRRLSVVVEDPLSAAYIRDIGYEIVAQSDDPSQQFTFFLVENDAVNAFAAPGGYIGVHSGLVLLAEEESELAGVLAHEVAHVTQKHIARAIERQQKVNLPLMLLALGAAIAAAGSDSGDGVPAALMGGQALAAQLQINFTRSNEYEADRVGIRTLARAGFDPDGMANFFSKMTRLSRNYGEGPPEFLRTHPVGTSRIAEAENRAKQVRVSETTARDERNFQLIRERLRVITNDEPNTLVAHYKELMAAGKAQDADHYGLALAYLQSGRPLKATEALDHFRQGESSLPISLLEAEAAIRLGQLDVGKAKFSTLKERLPRNLAVRIMEAEAYLQAGMTEELKILEEELRPMLTRNPDEPGLFLTYSRIAGAANQTIRAREAHAEYMLHQGRVYDAVVQLENLAKQPDLSYYQRARIDARLAEIRPLLAKLQEENGYDPSEGKRRRY